MRIRICGILVVLVGLRDGGKDGKHFKAKGDIFHTCVLYLLVGTFREMEMGGRRIYICIARKQSVQVCTYFLAKIIIVVYITGEREMESIQKSRQAI